MENTIKQLLEKTQEFEMFFALAFTLGGNPSIGFRSTNSDPLINNNAWLIAADAFRCNKQIENIHEMLSYPEDEIYIDLRAQGFISGCIVDIHLGCRYIKNIKRISDEKYTFIAYKKDE